MNNSLLVRFKSLFEDKLGYKVIWSELDSYNNLMVGVKCPTSNMKIILKVYEGQEGEIFWR
ncbi:MAG: hypothetical protein ACRC7N_11755 [Clostridium sp.]